MGKVSANNVKENSDLRLARLPEDQLLFLDT